MISSFTIPIEEATTPEDKLAEFRAVVRIKAGYVSALLYGLIPQFVEGLGTMGVTKNLVHLVDPVWIMRFDEFKGAFLYMHEISHVMRDTHGRRGDRDPILWNKAADIPINDDLIDAGWTPPDGDDAPLIAATFGFPKGLSAEEYYDLLLQQQQKKGGKGKDPDEKPHLCSGHCGGVAGNPTDGEQKLDEEIGRSPLDTKSIQRQVLDDLKRHVAQGRGTVPAGFKSLLTLDKKKSKIRWRNKVRSLLRKASGRVKRGGRDFSLSRPSHGSYARGIPRPGLIEQEPVILFIEDTSGSMGRPQLQAARREARAVLTSLGITRAWWMDADAAVSAPPRMISVRDLEKIPVHGGGGTDFRPALEAGMRLRPRPNIIVYLTDGDGTAPRSAPPGVVVIWCIVPSYHNKRPAPWGHAVIMRDEGDEKEYPQFEEDEDDDDDE